MSTYLPNGTYTPTFGGDVATANYAAQHRAQQSLNEVRVATEELLIATTRDLDAARTAAKHAESVAKFYLDTIASMHRDEREVTHRADILARRCAEQAHTIAQLLAKYEPAAKGIFVDGNKNSAIHAALAVMQRQGVR